MCIFIYSSSVLSLQNVMLEHVIYEMYVNDIDAKGVLNKQSTSTGVYCVSVSSRVNVWVTVRI